LRRPTHATKQVPSPPDRPNTERGQTLLFGANTNCWGLISISHRGLFQNVPVFGSFHFVFAVFLRLFHRILMGSRASGMPALPFGI
jgi:hypothetical protein